MRTKGKLHRIVRAVIALALAGILALTGVFLMVCYRENNLLQPGAYGAMLVHGSRINRDGTPSENLLFRLETALESWQETPCLIICCGGQGKNEPAPEGEVMRQWLIDRGVPENQVLSETESTNTVQGIKNAAEMLKARGINTVLMVTSAYHVPRAVAMGEDAGLTSYGLGSAYTMGADWLRHHARETLSWIKYWGQKYLHLPID